MKDQPHYPSLSKGVNKELPGYRENLSVRTTELGEDRAVKRPRPARYRHRKDGKARTRVTSCGSTSHRMLNVT